DRPVLDELAAVSFVRESALCVLESSFDDFPHRSEREAIVDQHPPSLSITDDWSGTQRIVASEEPVESLIEVVDCGQSESVEDRFHRGWWISSALRDGGDIDGDRLRGRGRSPKRLGGVVDSGVTVDCGR